MPCMCFIFANANYFSSTAQFLAEVPQANEEREDNEEQEGCSKCPLDSVIGSFWTSKPDHI